MAGGTVDNWGASSVRAVVFADDLNVPANDLFLTAFGQQASNFSNPPPNLFGAPSVASNFDRDGQHLILQRSAGRIDLFCNPSQPQGLVGGPPQLMDIVASLDAIQSAASKISSLANRLSRISIMIDFSKSYETNREANKMIREILPFELPVIDELDFFIQFTRRYELESVDNTIININYRWAVILLQQIVFNAMPISNINSPTQAPNFPRSTFFLAQFSLDLNSLQDSVVDTRRAKDIFKEMVSKINQIRHSGPIEN